MDLGKQNSIVMNRSKGNKIADLLEYFLEKEATIALKLSEKQITAQTRATGITLDSFSIIRTISPLKLQLLLTLGN